MKELITAAIKFVKERLKDCYDGHDYYHIERVYKKAIYLARSENANTIIVSLACLLHDIDNPKVTGRDTDDCVFAREFLNSNNLEPENVKTICDIINFVSNRPSGKHMRNSKEARVVWDANALDALGAIGIARAFSYSAINKQIMYDGNISNANTIKYFYDELFPLADMMMTETGQKIAQERHEFMERYLQQFYYEWNA